MTDTLQTQVARSLSRTLNACDCDECIQYTIDAAYAALAIAKPIIRAQVIEELAEDADAEGWKAMLPASVDQSESVGSLADWLRAQKENDQ
jgi:uncharacterized protein